MRKQTILYFAVILLLSACAAQRGQNRKTISIEPSPYIVMTDTNRQATVNLFIHVPEHYFSKRSRLVISPQLTDSNQVVKEEYTPIVLDAGIYRKKAERKAVLTGYQDSLSRLAINVTTDKAYRLPYSQAIILPSGLEKANLMAVVSADGCGSCTGIDTLSLASIYTPPVVIVAPIETPDTVLRPYVIVGKGVANLQFDINQWNIDLDRGNNRVEMEKIVQAIRPIVEDSLATLESVNIIGVASADGPFDFNATLAYNRANSAKEWLSEQFNFDKETKNHIQVSSRPEGWEPVLQAMIADGNPCADQVKDILVKYGSAANDDMSEQYIRRLPCWEEIKKYLSKDRKVEYTYSYSLKGYTEEIVEKGNTERSGK